MTEEQIVKTEVLLKSSISQMDAINKLKEYFKTINSELESKGVDSDYLAYAIVIEITKE